MSITRTRGMGWVWGQQDKIHPCCSVYTRRVRNPSPHLCRRKPLASVSSFTVEYELALPRAEA